MNLTCVVFAYHNIGIIGLDALLRHGFQVLRVLSNPDDAEENRWFDSVRDWCLARRIPCDCPANPNDGPWPETVAALRPGFVFSFYYRHVLHEPILQSPTHAALNLHGSLLPRYRGCAPVNWAIICGETQTGVTLHHMTRRIDAGDIVDQEAVPIREDDTALSVFRKIEPASRQLLDRALPLLAIRRATRTPQDESQSSYFRRRTPADGLIHWDQPTRTVCNLIRGVTLPYPGAFSTIGGKPLIVWRALPCEATDLGPGRIRIADSSVCVGTADGAIRIHHARWDGVDRPAADLPKLFQTLGTRQFDGLLGPVSPTD
jgi:UDP-4-amino-4-deoxy-L-arabinose formyltransferase/UDP-glucuronic acid dehydrogenase (UDP-4-keto-hexauronic acid decarboxylating)